MSLFGKLLQTRNGRQQLFRLFPHQRLIASRFHIEANNGLGIRTPKIEPPFRIFDAQSIRPVNLPGRVLSCDLT